jgi:hypothetical protein
MEMATNPFFAPFPSIKFEKVFQNICLRVNLLKSKSYPLFSKKFKGIIQIKLL